MELIKIVGCGKPVLNEKFTALSADIKIKNNLQIDNPSCNFRKLEREIKLNVHKRIHLNLEM